MTISEIRKYRNQLFLWVVSPVSHKIHHDDENLTVYLRYIPTVNRIKQNVYAHMNNGFRSGYSTDILQANDLILTILWKPGIYAKTNPGLCSTQSNRLVPMCGSRGE